MFSRAVSTEAEAALSVQDSVAPTKHMPLAVGEDDFSCLGLPVGRIERYAAARAQRGFGRTHRRSLIMRTLTRPIVFNFLRAENYRAATCNI